MTVCDLPCSQQAGMSIKRKKTGSKHTSSTLIFSPNAKYVRHCGSSDCWKCRIPQSPDLDAVRLMQGSRQDGPGYCGGRLLPRKLATAGGVPCYLEVSSRPLLWRWHALGKSYAVLPRPAPATACLGNFKALRFLISATQNTCD